MLKLTDLSLRYFKTGPLILEQVQLEVGAGELVALVGESGSGKSSLLRAIAGLEEPQTGNIWIDGDQVVGHHQFVAPQKRRVGLVFQEYALFPHLNVWDNVGYGLSKPLRSERVAQMLKLVGLANKGKRFPHELSGGEQQRVALARALAPQPRILLLDEPFSNLDEALKDRVRAELVTILRQTGITAVLVTHDIRDAMATADQIVVLRAGKIQQIAPPAELYNQPMNEYVARFFGKANFLTVLERTPEKIRTILGWHSVKKNVNDTIMVRPEQLSIDVEQENNQTVARGKVKNKFFLGAFTEWLVELDGQKLIVHGPDSPIAEGDSVSLGLKASGQFWPVN